MAPSETTKLLSSSYTSNLRRSITNEDRVRYNSISSQGGEVDVDEEDFDTTYKYEAKLLFKYSAPLVVTYLLQYSYSLITVFVAGRLGTDELGAASLASMIANITGLCVYEGLATALDTLTSQAYGSGKKKLVGLHVQRMFALMLAATIPIWAIWLAAPFLLDKIIPEKELARLAGRFLRVYLIGAPGYGIFEAGKRFTQAQGNFTASLVVLAVCAPLNVLWNWLFVFKFGLGFEGAALAPVVSLTLQPLVLLLYINLFAKDTLECWPGFSVKESLRNWGPMLRLGLSGVSMVLSEWLAFDILTFASTYISTEALAAQSVLMSVSLTTYHIPMPTAIAASTRFGNLIGGGALTAARKAVWFYYLVFVGIGVFNLVMLTLLRHVIALVFTHDVNVRAIIISTMPLMAGAQMFDAAAAIANGLLRGLGRQNVGGWANLAVYYLWAVPLSLFLTFGPAHMGVTGLWIGPLSGLGFVFIIVTVYIKKADWAKAVEEARTRED